MITFVTRHPDAIAALEDFIRRHEEFNGRLDTVREALDLPAGAPFVHTGVGGRHWLIGVRGPETAPDGWKWCESSQSYEPDPTTRAGSVAGQLLLGLGGIPHIREILPPLGMPDVVIASNRDPQRAVVVPAVTIDETRSAITVQWPSDLMADIGEIPDHWEQTS